MEMGWIVARLDIERARQGARCYDFRCPTMLLKSRPKALVQDDRTRDALPFGSQGGTVVWHHFPVGGEYTLAKLSIQFDF